jgi:DnaJ-class molecular chaperone
MKTGFQFLMVMMMALAVYAQGLIICKSCGREAKPGETNCSRCTSELPKPKKERPVGEDLPAIDVSDEISKLAVSAVQENFRLARKAETNESPAIAYWYFKNAMAMTRLVPSDRLPKEVSTSLMHGCERTMEAVKSGIIRCKVCQGKGKLAKSKSIVRIGGVNKTKLESTNKLTEPICPMCNGRGNFTGMADVPQIKTDLLRGRAEYEQRTTLTGAARLGRVFAPADLEKYLTAKQRALVMTGFFPPCESCQGIGAMACTTCKGERWVKCPLTGCKNGRIDVQKTDTNTRKEVRLNDTAEDKTICPRCYGVGEIRCQKCDSRGSVACQTCSGSGQAVRCTRCLGLGVQECTRCKGEGKLKGSPCKECKGEGSLLCTNCRGEGARTR